MLEAAMMHTTMMLAFSTAGVALSTMATPSVYAPQIAAVFVSMFGGLMVQLWTMEKRKPTRRVMIADLMASAFSGFGVSVIGVPVCLGIINRFLPETAQLQVESTDHLGVMLFIAGVAGMFGAQFLRKKLDEHSPGWMSSDGKQP